MSRRAPARPVPLFWSARRGAHPMWTGRYEARSGGRPLVYRAEIRPGPDGDEGFVGYLWVEGGPFERTSGHPFGTHPTLKAAQAAAEQKVGGMVWAAYAP